MTITKKLSLAAAVGVAAVAVPSYASTLTWVAGNNANADMKTPADWSPATAPSNGDTLIFQNADQVTFTNHLLTNPGEIEVQGTAVVDIAPSSATSMTIGVVDLTTSSSGTQLKFDTNLIPTISTSLSTASGTTLVVSHSTSFPSTISHAGLVKFNAGQAIDAFTGQSGTVEINAACTTSAAYTCSGTLMIDNGATLTPGATLTNNSTFNINTGGEVIFVGKNLSGTGTLNMNGTFEVRNGTCSIAAGQSISDTGGAWRAENVSGAGTVQFNASYTGATQLVGTFDAGASCIIDVGTSNVTVSTTGSFTVPMGDSKCSHVNHGTSGEFDFSGGSCS